MRNRQTCTISHLNMILPTIALVIVETLEIIGEVIRCPGVHQPGRRSGRAHGGSVAGTLIVVGVAAEVVVVAVATVGCHMPPVAAYLAARTLLLAAARVATGLLRGVLAVASATSPPYPP